MPEFLCAIGLEVMMRTEEWRDYFSKRVAEAESELASFESAMAKHGLRIFHRDAVNGERDVTDHELLTMKSQIEEYRAMLRED